MARLTALKQTLFCLGEACVAVNIYYKNIFIFFLDKYVIC